MALHQGYVWLAEIDSVAVGLLIAVCEQNIWVPDCYQLRELVWYVREEYRRSAATGRLFIRFCQKADELLELGEIDGYFTTRMGSTPDYTLEDRGFRATETLYLKTREGM